MPRFFRALLVLPCILAPAFGQAPAAGSTPPAMSAAAPFSLDQAIALALKKNFDLQIQAYAIENAKDTITIAKSVFDPTLTANATRSVNQQASVTTRLEDVSGTARVAPRTDSATLRVGANERIAATNGSVGVSANVSRTAANTNALLNPNFGNGVSANLNQPLLNGAGRFNATAATERAKLGLNIALLTYQSSVLTVINNTEIAYYNLVTQRENLRINQLTLEAAQKLFEENQARRATGVATDLDVLSAEVGVANARRSIVQSDQAVRDAEDNLLNLINLPNFDLRVGPVSFDDYKEGPPNFAQSYKLARDRYPQKLSNEEAIKQLEIDVESARRNLLPTLDLNAQLGYTARATSAGYEQAIANLPNDHGNNWALGLNYSTPWGRHADKARYRTALTNLNRSKVQLDQLEQSLIVQVRTAVRAVEANLAAVEIATKATELALKQYEQQKARFDAGLSTSRQVLLTQDDLESARRNELTTRLQLRRAAAELHRLEGTSLQKYGVQMPQ
jgi:outer membrane protein TolC